MIAWRTGKWVLAVAAVCAGLAPGQVSAQVGTGAAGAGMFGAGAGSVANPYLNPYVNPFMNPFVMSQANMKPADAALYFMAAQQSLGGIGSGRLSGTRPLPGASPDPARGTKPAGAVGSSMVPGGNAARYFNRDPQRHGAATYYARQSRYFPRSGR